MKTYIVYVKFINFYSKQILEFKQGTLARK